MVPTEGGSGILRGSGKSSDNSKRNRQFFIGLDESGHSNFISKESSLLLVFIGVNDASGWVIIAYIDLESQSIEDALQRRFVRVAKTCKPCNTNILANTIHEHVRIKDDFSDHKLCAKIRYDFKVHITDLYLSLSKRLRHLSSRKYRQ